MLKKDGRINPDVTAALRQRVQDLFIQTSWPDVPRDTSSPPAARLQTRRAPTQRTSKHHIF